MLSVRHIEHMRHIYNENNLFSVFNMLHVMGLIMFEYKTKVAWKKIYILMKIDWEKKVEFGSFYKITKHYTFVFEFPLIKNLLISGK